MKNEKNIKVHWLISEIARQGRSVPALLRSGLNPTVSKKHILRNCGTQAHLQLWPLFAWHKGNTSFFPSKACTAFH